MKENDNEKIRQLRTIRQTQAKRVNNLFIKQKAWLKTKLSMVEYQEPVAFFIRRSGEVEFFENVTSGMFKYQHSGGGEQFLIIDPNKQLKFGYGDRRFKGYILHEDHPLPLPEQPTITAEQMNIIIDKSLNDMKEWKAKEYRAKGDMWKNIGIAIAIIIGAIALFVMLKPQGTTKIIEVATPVVQQAIQNITPNVLG